MVRRCSWNWRVTTTTQPSTSYASQRVSLPPIEPLDPSGLDVSSLSLVKLMRLDVPRLSDEQLLVALQRSVLKDLRPLEYRLGGEALSRSTLEQKIDHDAVYRVVVRTSPDSATSMQWIEQAGGQPKNAKSRRPVGCWSSCRLESYAAKELRLIGSWEFCELGMRTSQESPRA